MRVKKKEDECALELFICKIVIRNIFSLNLSTFLQNKF